MANNPPAPMPQTPAGGPRRLWRPLNRFTGFAWMVLRRMRFQFSLTLLSLLTIVLAVGLVTNTSFFSRAVDRVILTKNLEDFSKTTGRPAFSTSVEYIPANIAPVGVADAERFSEQISAVLVSKVGLPVRHNSLAVSGGGMLLQSEPGVTKYALTKGYLDTIEPVYVASAAGHITVSDGKPYSDGYASPGVLEVWLHDSFGQKLGINVGETFQFGATLTSTQIKIKVAGFWHSNRLPDGKPDSEFWFNDPDSNLANALLVTRADYLKFIQPDLPSKTRGLTWYIILDESKVNTSRSAQYIDGFRQATIQLNKSLPGIRLNTPPLDPLQKFVTSSSTLTLLLLGYNLPAFFILLYFLILTSSIVARWQRRETTLLVSRGLTTGGVVFHVLVEQVLLLLLGLPLGTLFGMGIARVMGYSASFLTFTTRAALPVSIGDISLPLTAAAVLIAVGARLSPAVQAARASKVVEEREWARSTRKPTWYRYYLDLLLIVPTYYAYDQLTHQGSLIALIVTKPDDLFRDPLLVLVPALAIITGSLVVMRLFAVVMRLLDAAASLTPWLTIHLALRQLSRSSGDYLRPLLLVIISLGLGVYTLSMAASLDQWQIDRYYYKNGADLVFSPKPTSGDSSPDTSWAPQPGDFLKVAGVTAATRVSHLGLEIDLGGGNKVGGHFLGVDRLDLPGAAWWRDDFAAEPLGGLMNRLAASSDGVLVDQRILDLSGLQVGDSFPVTVAVTYNLKTEATFTIVGTYDYFPTIYTVPGAVQPGADARDLAASLSSAKRQIPDVTLIGNLENLNNLFGFNVPISYWLKLQPGTDPLEVQTEVARVGNLKLAEVGDTLTTLAEEQGKMERVGIFGTLSVGFLATGLMAIIGLLLYSYASLRERVYHLAMLLAMGVERAQIVSQVVLEYAFLAVFGVTAGAGVGILASQLFVPFFRYTTDNGLVALPPIVPIIAWGQVWTLVAVFTGIVVTAEIVTITLAIRQRLAQLLK